MLMMMRCSSIHKRPSSVSPSNLSPSRDFFEYPDIDCTEGELEQARLNRASFHRRLQSTSHTVDEDTAPHTTYRSPSSPDGVEDATSSLGASLEPHSSWRFYTSFDNGEWKRHAVPVRKAEDEVKDKGGCEKASKRPTCLAAESTLRRSRQLRTTAANVQQSRLQMRLGDGPRDVGQSRWRASSVDNFRGSAASILGHSPEVGDVTLRRSPEVGNLKYSESWKSLSPTDSMKRSIMESNFSYFSGNPNKERTESGHSNTDILRLVARTPNTFEERIIIPTKYKTDPNKETSTGTSACAPGAPVPEITREAASDHESKTSEGAKVAEPTKPAGGGGLVRSIKVSTESFTDASAICSTGQDEVQVRKLTDEASAHHDDVGSRKSSKHLEEQSRTVLTWQSVDLNPPCKPEEEQFCVASKFVEGHGKNVSKKIENVTISDVKREPENVNVGEIPGIRKINNDQKILCHEGIRKQDQWELLSKSQDRENNFTSLGGRGLLTEEKPKQKSELTSQVANGKKTDDFEKTVKFVNVLFAEVNDERNRESNETKNPLVKVFVTDINGDKASDPRADDTRKGHINGTPTKHSSKYTNVIIECKDEDWIIEMAVRP